MSSRGDTGEIVLAANEQRKFGAVGSNYLHSFQQTGLVQVDLMKANKVIESHAVKRLVTFNDRDFDEFKITDISGAANTVRFFSGPGSYVPDSEGAEVTLDDSTPIDVNMVNGSITVNESVPNEVTTAPDVTVTNAATLVAASTADSLWIVLSVSELADNGVRVGDPSVTATRGHRLLPGSSVALSLQSHAVHAIRDGASNVDVSVMILRRVP